MNSECHCQTNLCHAVAVLLGVALVALMSFATAQESYSSDPQHDNLLRRNSWWAPGFGGTLPQNAEYPNDNGRVGIYLTDGPFNTAGHPFFEAIGSNGRACVTCHQPADGMSISLATIQDRWRATDGKDPLFAAIDGSNCPDLPQQDPESHSLLLQRGLFRVFLPWPPRDRDNNVIEPEFSIEVVRDPTGCNTSKTYGLSSKEPMISVYRRPRPAANLPYVTKPGPQLIIKTGRPADVDPDTGEWVSMNMMADAREPTLKTQAVSAALTHLQKPQSPSAEQLRQIIAFENQVYMAQSFDNVGGFLTETSGPPGLGHIRMSTNPVGVLANNYWSPVFHYFKQWELSPEQALSNDISEKQRFRASVARGNDIFMFRTFWISDTVHINSVGMGNPLKRTCATCHNTQMMGQDLTAGWMDLGVTNHPWAKPSDDLPLFKLTCHEPAIPHPYLGRVVYTQDPGRALISGRCEDVGSIVIQQMRGLSARTPLFSNGSAQSIREVIDYYDRRYNIHFTEQERIDLENFLRVL